MKPFSDFSTQSDEHERIVSRYLIKVPYAYPVPTVERDAHWPLFSRSLKRTMSIHLGASGLKI